MTTEFKNNERDEKGNVKFDTEKYNQICVWPSMILKKDKIDDFEKLFDEKFNISVKYLETIETFPDRDENGCSIENTGGRSDVFFAINLTNENKSFCIERLAMGIRWIEDALGEWNDYDENPIYPERVKEYRRW